MTINAIAEDIVTPVRWGDNHIVLGHALGDEALNPIDQFGGYIFSTLDFTTDTIPPYKGENNQIFKAIKVTSFTPRFNEIIHWIDGQGNHIAEPTGLLLNGVMVTVGQVITIQDIIDRNLKLSKAMSYADTVLTLGHFKFQYSVDGINFNEETNSRMDVFRTFKLDTITIRFLPSYTKEVNINDVSTVTMADLPLGFEYFFTGGIPDYNRNDVDVQTYMDMQGRFYPYKIEIRNIIGENCFRYFGDKLQIGQKIPINGIRLGQLKIDGRLLSQGSECSLEIAFGDSYTGAFKINPI